MEVTTINMISKRIIHEVFQNSILVDFKYPHGDLFNEALFVEINSEMGAYSKGEYLFAGGDLIKDLL